MKSLSLRKVLRVLLLSLFTFVIGFGGYVAFLSNKNDNACLTNEPTQSIESDLESAAQLQAVLDQYSQNYNNVGLQATVILPDGTQWNGVSGYANDAKTCPLMLDHNLYVGSITKTFTAALVMEQVEAGIIHLDDPVEEWIPYSDGGRITVEMLMRHTSGIPSYTDEIILQLFGLPQKQFSPDELFATIVDEPLKFEPGSRHEYSNTNYLLLGMILEAATGKPYGELLGNAVTQMDLDRIYFPAYPNSLILANGYDETLLNLGKRNLTAFRTSMGSGAYSAGGIAASSHDAAFFFHTLFSEQWLADETVAQMMTIMEASDEDVPLQKGYGLGVRNLVIDGESLYGHTGTIPGYSGIAMHNPQHGFTIVVLSNVSTIEQTTIFSDLQKVVLQYLKK
ncbi:MAG TPA: serine hydrolase domain-containing protein [Anaerolineales bacterium]|nr:serine hydrolase domain-containing protein [Anaerolineales bacterium]